MMMTMRAQMTLMKTSKQNLLPFLMFCPHNTPYTLCFNHRRSRRKWSIVSWAWPCRLRDLLHSRTSPLFVARWKHHSISIHDHFPCLRSLRRINLEKSYPPHLHRKHRCSTSLLVSWRSCLRHGISNNMIHKYIDQWVGWLVGRWVGCREKVGR